MKLAAFQNLLRASLPFALAATLAGPTEADILRIEGRVLEESDRDRTLISKPGWLRGLHVLGELAPTEERPKLLTVLPPSWAGETICARITSMGGDYAATVEFDAPETLTAARAADLSFDPSSDTPRNVTPENSGVSLEKGPCLGDTGDTGPREFIVNFWNQQAQPLLTQGGSAQLLLNMNIARADDILFVATLKNQTASQDTIPLTTSCEKLSDPKALAYNYQCYIAVPVSAVLSDAPSVLKVQYERVYRGRISALRSADIWIGAEE